jgi:ABC-2 type transport system permease protein
VSPAIVMHEGLADVAGSGVRRHQHFAGLVEAFQLEHQRFFRERIRAEAPLDRAAYDAMPTVVGHDEPLAALGARVLAGLAGLLLPTAALLVLAVARLRRPILVEAR